MLGFYGSLPLENVVSLVFFILNILFLGIGGYFTTVACITEFPLDQISFIDLGGLPEDVLSYFPEVNVSLFSLSLIAAKSILNHFELYRPCFTRIRFI